MIFFALSIFAYSQQKEDIDKLQLFEPKSKGLVFTYRDFLLPKSKNPLIKYNPVSLILGTSMYIYQNVMSPQLMSECPYNHTCSGFSKECIKMYGPIKGIALSADRLMRCNQFAVLDLKEIHFDKNDRIIDPPSRYRIRKR